MKKSTIILTLAGVITFILLGGFFLLSNVVHNVHYDYKSDEQVINGLKVGVRLLGEYKEDESNSVYAGPYELLIWFEADDNANLSTLNKVGVVNKESNAKSFTLAKSDADIKHENRTVYFSYKQVMLDYSDYDLLIEYQVKGSNETKTITLSLKKDYRKFTSFRFCDRIMSI